MSKQHSDVEQLWYTWSDVGLNTIRAGFRIRAASEGLQDIRSERVQHLDRYQRYSLPQEADPAIDPKIAPICLSLIKTEPKSIKAKPEAEKAESETEKAESERILVQKAYTGKDGVGRYGAFFVHLLAGLLEDFSARDAIALWKSPFWEKSDTTLADHYDTHLERVLLSSEQVGSKDQMWSVPKQLPYSGQYRETIQEYLPFVIQAYLRKKPLYEAGQTRPRPLYIIAPDDEVACLISGLAQCLPKRLLKDLTFSTYEHDIFEAPTEIVGTCWLSESVAQKKPLLERLFPSWYTQELLVLNCYTQTCSSLENNSFLENKPLAASFAATATRYFLDGDEEFEKFLEDAEECPDVDSLLSLYRRRIVNPQNPQEAITTAFQLQTAADYKNTVRTLSEPRNRQYLIYATKYQAGWWQQYKANIINLRQSGMGVPKLMDALLRVANEAATDAVNMVREKKAPLLKDAPTEVEAFKNITDLIYCLAPPPKEQKPCMSLLQGVLGIKDIAAFFSRHWDIYTYFVSVASILFPVPEENSELLAPLFTLSWGTLGAFLTLRLPLLWKEVAVKTLLSSPSSLLDSQTAVLHGQMYAYSIEEFFLAASAHTDYWEVLLRFFNRLAEARYPGKMPLLKSLLNSELGEDAQSVRPLLVAAHLTVAEQAEFLITYGGPRYLPLNNRMSLVILDMLDELSKRESPAKMQVLSAWLSSPPLPEWFCSSKVGEESLTRVLKKATLNPGESGVVLQLYDQVYIRRYPQSSTLVGLFEAYASGTKDRQSLQNMLDIWLSLPLEQQTLERLLIAARLTSDEQIHFLEHYGLHYLKLFPQSPTLLSYAQAFSEYLWSVDLHFLGLNLSLVGPSYLEQLLDAFRRSPHAYTNICEFWYTIAFFVREPGLLQVETQKVSRYANRLLEGYEARKYVDACATLLQLLARACIENKDMLEHLVEVFSSILLARDLMLLLYEIADCTQERIYRQPEEKALFLPCILCAYKSKEEFDQEEQRMDFFKRFLNTLLQHTDKKMRQWINDETKRQHFKIAPQWQKYIVELQYPLSPERATTSPISRYLLWREGNTARPLLLPGRGKATRLAQVSVEYMTTLNRPLSDEWRSKIGTAAQKLKALEAIVRQASHVVAPQLTMPAKGMLPQQSSGGAHNLPVSKKVIPTAQGIVQKQFWFRRPRVSSQLNVIFPDRQAGHAFKEVQRALRSGQIGRIVRVTTDYIDVLEAYYKYVPDAWWSMLDAAFDFFIACEVPNTYDPVQEQSIIIANKKIQMLVAAQQPSPILNEHERQRVQTALQRVAALDMQKQKDADREWIRSALPRRKGMEATTRLNPPKKPAETPGFLTTLPDWLARWLQRLPSWLTGWYPGQGDGS